MTYRKRREYRVVKSGDLYEIKYVAYNENGVAVHWNDVDLCHTSAAYLREEVELITQAFTKPVLQEILTPETSSRPVVQES